MPDPLPPVLAELKTLVGWQVTASIVRRWGGTRLYVPQRLPEGHPLVETAGLAAARKIARRFAGELGIPRAHRLLIAQRNAEIVRRTDTGEPASRLARDYQLTERQIRSIIARATRTPAAAPQLTLFSQR